MPHSLELNKKCSHSDKNCLICIKEECNCLGPSCYECAFFNHKGPFDSCIPIDSLKLEHNPNDISTYSNFDKSLQKSLYIEKRVGMI